MFKPFFRTIKLILLLLIICISVILMVNNREFIIIKTFPLPYEFEARCFMIMLFFFLFGFLFGKVSYSKRLFSFKSRKQQKKERKKERKKEKKRRRR